MLVMMDIGLGKYNIAKPDKCVLNGEMCKNSELWIQIGVIWVKKSLTH